MAFLHPLLAIVGISGIAIPIVIHFLLRRKRKPVMFGAMRFVIEAYRQQRSRIQLEHLLLLLLRCLVILLVAIAIARPMVQADSPLAPTTERSVYILLDTGLASSTRTGDQGVVLDSIKDPLDELLGSLRDTDRVALVTLASPASQVVMPPTGDIDTVRTLIRQAGPTHAGSDIQAGLRIVLDDLRAQPASGTHQSLVVLATSQLEGSVDLGSPFPEEFASFSNTSILILDPEQESVPNTQITSLEPLRSVFLMGEDQLIGGGQVTLTLRRTGGAERDDSVSSVRVWIERDGRPETPATTTVRWQPGQREAVAALQLAPHESSREYSDTTLVGEIDRDALEVDNTRRAPLPLRQVISVGLLTRRQFGQSASLSEMGSDEWLRRALVPNDRSPIEIRDIEPSTIDSSALSGVDVAILPRPDLLDEQGWARLRRFVDTGGMLIVTPPEHHEIHLWSDLMVDAFDLDVQIARESSVLDTPAGLVATDAPTRLLTLLRGELQPMLQPIQVHRVLRLSAADSTATSVLSLDDGTPWYTSITLDHLTEEGNTSSPLGSLYLLASSPHLDWTNLPAMPLMVPLIQESVRQGVASGRATQSIVAGRNPLVGSDTASFELISTSQGSGESVRANEPLRHSGVYSVQDDLGGQEGIVVVNPNVEAGRTTRVESDEIRQWIEASGVEAERVTLLTPGASDREDAFRAVSQESSAALSVTLLAIALGLAIVETMLARFFSHATLSRSVSPTTHEMTS
ncbi:MAG: BatA domain-containing protein [Planctomycetota bacterium]|jgi:hypothetical protein